jgi:hypothetical protein
MTIYYPDISGWQGNIDLAGVVAACAKVTEGTSYASPSYAAQKAEAARSGAFFFGYHFLHHGDPVTQAGWAHQHAGATPLMVDFEPTGSSTPQLTDTVAFIKAYRAAGGTSNLVYLPHWYWQQIGSPSLNPLLGLGMVLVSSAYPGAYSDNGSGWTPYGGMTPAIWQYTATQAFHGQRVDFNAFRGTLAQLKALVTGQAYPPGMPASVLHVGSQGPDVVTLQEKLAGSGLRGVRGITVDGVFGQQTETAVKNLQELKGLIPDGIVGPQTWAAVWALLNQPKGASVAPETHPQPGRRPLRHQRHRGHGRHLGLASRPGRDRRYRHHRHRGPDRHRGVPHPAGRPVHRSGGGDHRVHRVRRVRPALGSDPHHQHRCRRVHHPRVCPARARHPVRGGQAGHHRHAAPAIRAEQGQRVARSAANRHVAAR